jgi:hypothetical protein
MFEHPDRNVVNKPEQKSKKKKVNSQNDDCHLTGSPVPIKKAKQRWPHRYLSKVFIFYLPAKFYLYV